MRRLLKLLAFASILVMIPLVPFGGLTAPASNHTFTLKVIQRNPVSTCAEARALNSGENCLSITTSSGGSGMFLSGNLVLQVTRGSHIVIPLILTLGPGAGSTAGVNVVFYGNGTDLSDGYIIPGGTHQEGLTTAPGTFVGIDQFMSFSPSSVTIFPDSIQRINLTISIPSSFPQAMVGQNLDFTIPYQIQGGGEVYGPQATVTVRVP